MSEIVSVTSVVARDILGSDVTMSVADALCNRIGPRPVCSEEMKNAVEYIAERLVGFGLKNVRLENVPLKKWIRGKSILEFGDGHGVENLPFSFVEDCVAEGPLVDVSYGVPESFLGIFIYLKKTPFRTRLGQHLWRLESCH